MSTAAMETGQELHTGSDFLLVKLRFTSYKDGFKVYTMRLEAAT